MIAADEYYSELYFDESSPPPGLLTACAALGRSDYKRCVLFHSLSKRSNLPGLRSGFVAADADILKAFLLYRTYHGCAMPVHSQLASVSPGKMKPMCVKTAICTAKNSTQCSRFWRR